MQKKSWIPLLLSANAISGFAQGISMLSIPWYFAHKVNDMKSFGIAYAISTIISLFWSLYAGALVDRYNRKHIFLLLNLVCGCIIGAVALIGFNSGGLNAFLVSLIFIITSLNYNLHYPALYAFAQEVSDKSNYGRINSMLEIQGQATTVLAGALGAILLSGTQNQYLNFLGLKIPLAFDIKAWEMHEIFMMDAITYFIAIVLIAVIKYVPDADKHIDYGSIVERMKGGFSYLKEHPLISLFGHLSYSIFVFLIVEIHLLLPLYVNNHLHENADVYAASEIFYAVGALMAGYGIRQFFKETHTVTAVIYMMLMTTLIIFIATFTCNSWIFFAFSLLIGVSNAGTRVLRVTYLFEQIPNHVIGRTGAVFQVVNIAIRSLFILLFSIPFFATGNNVIWAYFIGAVFLIISAIPLIVKHKELT